MNKQKLPEGWKEVEFQEIASFTAGFAFSSSGYKNSGIKIIRIQNLGNNKDEKFVYWDGKYDEKYLIKEGDLLLSLSGTIPVSFKIHAWKGDNALLNQRILKINLDENLADKNYIEYAVFNGLINVYSKATSTTGIANVSMGTVKSLNIILPPLETQKKIVSLLVKAEKSKEWRKEADDLTKDFLKSVFLEMFGDKSKFEQVTLNDIANLSMGGTPSTKEKTYWENGTVNWMKSGNIKGDYIYSIPQKITELGHKKSNASMFPKDTVVIALNGQGKTRGTTAILKVETTSNQSVVGIMIDKEKISSEYLHYNLKTRYSEIRNLTGDSDRSGLNLSILRSFKILLPPIELQNKFASIVKEVEAMKGQQKHSKNQIDNLFNALMQKAFKGELKC